jgi:excisionase family DNA binding protein
MEDASGNKLLTVPQTADVLQVSITTVRRMIAETSLPAVKIRGQYRVPAAAIDGQIERAISRVPETGEE